MYFSQLLAEERIREFHARAASVGRVKEARRSTLRRRARIDQETLQAALAEAVDLEAARRIRAAQASELRSVAERRAREAAAAAYSCQQPAVADGWGGAQSGLSA